MANPEHLAILEKGIENWNEWRTGHSHLKPVGSVAQTSRVRIGRLQQRKL
jgi:hypothetical protein